MDKQVFFQHLMFRFVIEFLAETESPALGITIVVDAETTFQNLEKI